MVCEHQRPSLKRDKDKSCYVEAVTQSHRKESASLLQLTKLHIQHEYTHTHTQEYKLLLV